MERTTKIPSVLRTKEITEKVLTFIFVQTASIVTPISSGRGEAMMNTASEENRYFFSENGMLQLIFFTADVRASFSTSSIIECLTTLNIIMSATSEPNPPIRLAKNMFWFFETISNIAVAGPAVKPYEYPTPHKKEPR